MIRFPWRMLGVLLMLVPSVASGQELRVGDVYVGSVKLTDAMGGIQLPLPNGSWRLIGLQRDRAGGFGNVGLLNGRLVATDLDSGRRPRALITFNVATEASQTGWAAPQFCASKSLHYVEPKDARENHGGGEYRCWGIDSQLMKPAENAPRYVHEAYDWVAQNTSGMPLTTIRAVFYRSSGPKHLHVEYMFNPEAANFNRMAPVLWHPDRVGANKTQVDYIERIKRFGVAWMPKIEHGFAGKALSPQDATLAADADPMNVSGLPPGRIMSCAEEGTLKPAVERAETKIAFQNHRSTSVNLYWLDGKGERRPNGAVEPRHWKRMRTDVAHPWIVADAAGRCLEIVMPGQTTQWIVLND